MKNRYYYDIVKNKVKGSKNKFYIEFMSYDDIDNDEYCLKTNVLNDIQNKDLSSRLELVMDNFYSFKGKKLDFILLINDENNFEKIPKIFYNFT